MNILTKFRIPTLLGLLLIIGGMAGGVYLVLQNQTLQSRASPDLTPQNVEVTNIEEGSFSVSWQTAQETLGFVIVNIAGSDQTVLDDRDPISPQSKILHHVTVKNLTPQTTYQYKIVSGKLKLPPSKITTAGVSSFQNGLKPVIGQVAVNNQFLPNGLVFLEVADSIKQSAPIKEYGNFVIPLSSLRKSDLSDVFLPDDQTIGKIEVMGENLKSTVTFYLKDSEKPLPLLHLGESLDLTKPSTILGAAIPKFDLNEDGLINSSDYSIVLRNFGKNPKEKKADLNGDGVVDKKDLELIQTEINKSLNK